MKEYLIEFNQLAMANASGADDMLNRVMTKDNIGIAALLELKEGYLNYSNDVSMPRQQVLVSNVHIHWDPEFKDVKLIQTVMLMHELMNIMQEINPGFMVQGGELISRFCTVDIGIVCYTWDFGLLGLLYRYIWGSVAVSLVGLIHIDWYTRD